MKMLGAVFCLLLFEAFNAAGGWTSYPAGSAHFSIIKPDWNSCGLSSVEADSPLIALILKAFLLPPFFSGRR